MRLAFTLMRFVLSFDIRDINKEDLIKLKVILRKAGKKGEI